VEKRKNLKRKKTDVLGSIGKQSGESAESVLKKKRKATVGRICRKGGFRAWNEKSDGVMNDESGESMQPTKVSY